MYLFPMDRPGITTSKLSKIGNNMCGTYEVYLHCLLYTSRCV